MTSTAGRRERLARDWDAAGRPSPAGLRIRAYPPGRDIPATAGQVVIEKPATTLVLTWS